jgi:hypothetical protein
MKGWLTDGGHPLYVVWRGSEKDKKRSSQRGEEKSLKEEETVPLLWMVPLSILRTMCFGYLQVILPPMTI